MNTLNQLITARNFLHTFVADSTPEAAENIKKRKHIEQLILSEIEKLVDAVEDEN